ncbi:hypothetical protein MMC10_004111 [Thelotrema lepadinum]|nr:hypothetical protein [Thelotrema lepadinum]
MRGFLEDIGHEYEPFVDTKSADIENQESSTASADTITDDIFTQAITNQIGDKAQQPYIEPEEVQDTDESNED